MTLKEIRKKRQQQQREQRRRNRTKDPALNKQEPTEKTQTTTTSSVQRNHRLGIRGWLSLFILPCYVFLFTILGSTNNNSNGSTTMFDYVYYLNNNSSQQVVFSTLPSSAYAFFESQPTIQSNTTFTIASSKQDDEPAPQDEGVLVVSQQKDDSYKSLLVDAGRQQEPPQTTKPLVNGIRPTNSWNQRQETAAVSALVAANPNAIINVTNYINKWYGWQPKIAMKLKCPWRMCFREKVTCATCRVSRREWGISPYPPHPDWIPDVTMLKRMYMDGVDNKGNPWPPPLESDLCQPISGTGSQLGDLNLEALRRVPVHSQPRYNHSIGNNQILCLMYTIEPNHATSVRAARETWIPGCDGFLAFSTMSDPRIPAISIPHQGREEYGNMWQKVRSIWNYVAKTYLEEFDFFYLGGDDMYVLTQNLRTYLKDLNGHDDHYLGRRFQRRNEIAFNTGGPGYVLSRSALQKLASSLDHPDCFPDMVTSAEDVMVATCLLNVWNITVQDTRDAKGRERFHLMSPAFQYRYGPPKRANATDWYGDLNYKWGVKTGRHCCAHDSIAFHYIRQPAMVRHLHKLLYGNDCQAGT